MGDEEEEEERGGRVGGEGGGGRGQHQLSALGRCQFSGSPTSEARGAGHAESR